MARPDDLRSIQVALTTIGRVQNSRRARRRIEDLAGVPIAPTTIATLAAVVALAPVRHGPIAARIGIQPSRVSKEVRILVEGGMVTESPDPHDRRAVLLDPTDKGVDAYVRYTEAAREILGDVLADWSARDVAELDRLTTRLATAFAAVAADPPEDRS